MLNHASSPFWKQLCGIDLRTLALFRVVLAVAVMCDLINLWPDVFVFLDDRGLIPRADAVRRISPYSWSVFFINGHVAWAYGLLFLAWAAALAMLIGYRTRLAVFLCWLLIASLSARISFVISSADMQLTLLLFWAMFMPLGARFSVDAALSKRPKGENAYVSWATLAVMLQVGYLYFFGALTKTGSFWRETYDVIYYVLNTADINSPLAPYMPQWFEAMRWLTWYVLYLELIAIFFLFSPIKNALCRLAMLPLLITLHLGFLLLLAVSFFPIVSISGLMVFFPGLFWDWLLPRLNAHPRRAGIKIYYDQDCGFCRKTCQIFRELGLPPETPILPAQEHPEIYAVMQRDNSWVVEDGSGRRHTRWQAVAWVWRRSPILWPLGVLFLPRFMRPVGDAIYEWIATHRRELGKLTAKLLPEHERELAFRPLKVTQGFIAVLVVLVLAWNTNVLPSRPLGDMPQAVKVLLVALRLDQRWKVFAPQPRHLTQWVVIEGYLSDGKTVIDLLHQRMSPPSHGRPSDGYAAYPTHRWHKLFSRFDFGKKAPVLGRYFCQEGQEMLSFPRPPLKELVFYVYRQRTAPPGNPPLPVVKRLEFKYDCLGQRVTFFKEIKPPEKNKKKEKAPPQ